jgi:hypothetical protein
MFVVTEAATIRTAFEQQGELSTAVEVRRLFPGVTDMVGARGAPGPLPAGSRCLSRGAL